MEFVPLGQVEVGGGSDQVYVEKSDLLMTSMFRILVLNELYEVAYGWD